MGADSRTGKRLAVAGHGPAAHRLVEALRARDAAGTWTITVIGEEPRTAYDRVALTTHLEGAASPTRARRRGRRPHRRARHRDRPRRPDDHHLEGRDRPLRRARPGHRVGTVRAAGRGRGPAGRVHLPHHRRPGRDPRVRARPGDRRRRRRRAARPGGGPRLQGLGLRSGVVEVAPWLMPRQLDEGGGAMLRRHIEASAWPCTRAPRCALWRPETTGPSGASCWTRGRPSTPRSWCSPPAFARATSWRAAAACRWGSAAASWWTGRAAPRTPPSGRSANAHW